MASNFKFSKARVLYKDSVSNSVTSLVFDAGRKRGSIKNSLHTALIEAIEQAAHSIGRKYSFAYTIS